MRISVLGAGGWGTTLAILLHYNGHQVTLWEYKKHYAKTLRKTRENKMYLPNVAIPDEIEITPDLEDACTKQHMIIVAIPTQFIRSVLKQTTKLNFSDTTFVSVSKGIEKDTLLTVSKIIKDVLPDIDENNIGVLSGPSHAEEVSKKIPTAVVAAAPDELTAKNIQAAFMTSYLRVYSSTDIVGVELGGALKNVIAIGAGIVDGAGFGDNTKAAIMTRGIAEISRLGISFGAQPETFAGLSGMGDLIVTCMSRHSRNRFVGEQVGKGNKLKQVLKAMNMVAEGVETCRSVVELAGRNHVETPIANAVYKILFNEVDPNKATYELMTREIKSELDI
ncbi:MAG: NAD(P)H-dependent glycerol-3-phosphate dehydrogenase [Melioribacteraceae bacterium]|nr:NAD(P)H-dependent glycerol-3-phosphate dehydrogenase [Melioribacteraceae bacterium]MCF8353498.1 NAD(P)H-dependent glycerol-3-phosphate dehydrogenase [Melioribacteraceae bacterium]MCF8392627.1 NAD(P)H-dependent glycerol-3-phosphate dehydrogenase [Melioribacteraceae bacterium]MCF8418501.1 NAD(P)H-dependent glycerol-3-phosphate dehydrogenase [Melioribacteraceae bacterium]